MSKPNDTNGFATIDPTAMEAVTGGTSGGATNDQLTAALGGIVDALSSLSANQKQSPDMMQLCMFMMAMNSGAGQQQQTVACGPQPTSWNWVDGVVTPNY